MTSAIIALGVCVNTFSVQKASANGCTKPCSDHQSKDHQPNDKQQPKDHQPNDKQQPDDKQQPNDKQQPDDKQQPKDIPFVLPVPFP